MAKLCTNKGCGKRFDVEAEGDICLYHPGPEVFHEGLKIWKCCDVKKIEFEEWLKVPGCTKGKHSDVKASIPAGLKSDLSASGSSNPAPASATVADRNGAVPSDVPSAALASGTLPSSVSTVVPEQKVEAAPLPDQGAMVDDLTIPISVGTGCKRNGCKTQSSEDTTEHDEDRVSQTGHCAGRGPNYTCYYHSGTPVFHDASKGWTCCKRRVLEFDEFMKIRGCQKTQGHVFAQKMDEQGSQSSKETIQKVDLRIDHYQTPTSVIVSFFGKNVVPEKSQIRLDSQAINLSLFMNSAPGQPGMREYKNEIPLFDEIDASSSSYQIKSTKVEVMLVKAKSGIVWPDVDARKAVGVVERITYGTTNGKGGTTGAKWTPL